VRKEFDVLESPRYPEPSNLIRPFALNLRVLEENVTFAGFVDPVDAVEKRRLACAVRSYDGVDLPFLNLKPDVTKGFESSEGNRELFYFEKRHKFSCYANTKSSFPLPIEGERKGEGARRIEDLCLY